MNNRGQASLEYLFTYGWAFLGIMIAIGALMYFGIFDTDNLRGRECTFPPGVTCEDYALSDQVGGYDSLALDLRNTYGATINVTAMTMENDAFGTIVCGREGTSIPPAYVWDQENITLFVCDVSGSSNYYPGDTYELIVTINFTQANHTYAHYTKGTVVATAQ